jgi:hypothetical protein
MDTLENMVDLVEAAANLSLTEEEQRREDLLFRPNEISAELSRTQSIFVFVRSDDLDFFAMNT